MIIWLASYPKSGNTWLRVFLHAILFTEKGHVNFENLNNISQYPLRSHFKGLIKKPELLDVKKKEDIEKIFSNLIPSQERINLDKKIRFFKTHFKNVQVFGKNFTNKENTLGVIHIVRDPRNVITSVQKHYSKDNINEACDFILAEQRWIGNNYEEVKNTDKILSDNYFPTFIGSWGNHYKFWKKTKKNYLLIKYENLINDPEKEFNKVINYLEKLINLKVDKNKVKKAMETSSFENLKKLEQENKFKENVFNRSGSKVPFFNLGKKNDWRKILKNEIRLKIENKFSSEMEELSYL